MIKSAVECYGYEDEDVLNDVISSFATFGGSIGRVLGPICAGTLSFFLGIETSCAIIALFIFVFAVIFFLGTGYTEKFTCCKKKDNKVASTVYESVITKDNRVASIVYENVDTEAQVVKTTQTPFTDIKPED